MAFFTDPAQAGSMPDTVRLSGEGRGFLFLQGPHGPFFSSLAHAMRRTGAACWRVGFNGGDRLFWRDRGSYIAYGGDLAGWPDALGGIIAERRVTDIVIYGETRPVHAAAIDAGRATGLRLHIFEEGYLRPYWATYERDGSNGHSRLVSLSVAEMRGALTAPAAAPAPADRWGDLREHMIYGAIYHAAVLAGRRPGVVTHRTPGIAAEFRLHLARLLKTPLHAAERRIATARVLRSGGPYHVALLQLEHDPTFRVWSPFDSMAGFVDAVAQAFAEGAPGHHHLVFKAHPLEDGRLSLRDIVRTAAAQRGIADRVHFIPGGKLARLLESARGAVTINSTAAQQALWRGIPVKSLGEAVYAKPELVSPQPLRDFFATPGPPDPEAYAVFRRFLLETSQIGGGFYSLRGRRRLLRHVVDMMLDPADPYDKRIAPDAAATQQLRVVG